MLNLDAKQLADVISAALTHAASDPRWLKAIERGARELEENPWIEAISKDTLLIASPSGNVYAASDTCSCTAYTFHQPCWHRGAARLYMRYKAIREMDELFN